MKILRYCKFNKGKSGVFYYSKLWRYFPCLLCLHKWALINHFKLKLISVDELPLRAEVIYERKLHRLNYCEGKEVHTFLVKVLKAIKAEEKGGFISININDEKIITCSDKRKEVIKEIKTALKPYMLPGDRIIWIKAYTGERKPMLAKIVLSNGKLSQIFVEILIGGYSIMAIPKKKSPPTRKVAPSTPKKTAPATKREPAPTEPVKRGRGRPPGSKSKPKTAGTRGRPAKQGQKAVPGEEIILRTPSDKVTALKAIAEYVWEGGKPHIITAKVQKQVGGSYDAILKQVNSALRLGVYMGLLAVNIKKNRYVKVEQE